MTQAKEYLCDVLIIGSGAAGLSLALQLADKIRLALNQPFVLAGQLIPVFPSIGVAMFPQHSQSVSGLLQCADKAMYMAKKAGGNQTVLSAAMPQQQCTG